MDNDPLPDASKANRERHVFRHVVGLIAVTAGLVGLTALYAFPIPEPNKEPLLIALGVILGWGSQVIQSEYSSSETGRRLNDATIRALETEVEGAQSASEGRQSAGRSRPYV